MPGGGPPLAAREMPSTAASQQDWFSESLRSAFVGDVGTASVSSSESIPRPRATLRLDMLVESKPECIASWRKGMHIPALFQQASQVLGANFDKSLSYGSTPLGFTPKQLHELFRPRFCCSLGECRSRIPAKSGRSFDSLVRSNGDFLPEGVSCFTDGSFTAAGLTEPEQKGWSCVFFNKAQRTCDVLAGEVPAWYLAEYDAKSAFGAECWAIIVAMWLGVSSFEGAPINVFSDCQSAIAIANGDVAVRTPGVAQILGHVAGCCTEVACAGPFIQYIPGHKGCVGNELADLAAKAAAAGQTIGNLRWEAVNDPGWWQNQGVLWSWAGVVCRWAKGDDTLPSPLGCPLDTGRNSGGLSADAMVRPFLPDKIVELSRPATGSLSLRIASYNALSLALDQKTGDSEGLSYKPARPALLASQFENAGIQVAAVQEARTTEGSLRTGGFLRYCSGAVKGHLGVELWFREGCEIVSFERGASGVTFAEGAFVVLHQDPRRIIVLYKCGSCSIVFASLHAPHRGTDPAQLSEWWAATEDILHKLARGRPLVIGADCNASVGSVESAFVSTCGAEETG